VRISVGKALEAAKGADRAMARRAVRALVDGIEVSAAGVEVRLRVP
jgi:hypothetical protein